MKSKFDASYIGLLAGIVVPLIGLFIFYKYNFRTLNFFEFIDHAVRMRRIPQLVSVSVIVNLGVFYFFIWKKFYYSARGVIGATVIYVLIVLVLKYFV